MRRKRCCAFVDGRGAWPYICGCDTHTASLLVPQIIGTHILVRQPATNLVPPSWYPASSPSNGSHDTGGSQVCTRKTSRDSTGRGGRLDQLSNELCNNQNCFCPLVESELPLNVFSCKFESKKRLIHIIVAKRQNKRGVPEISNVT